MQLRKFYEYIAIVMISISLKSIKELEGIEEIEILSIDVSLYIVRLFLNGQIYRVSEEDGSPYRRFSIEEIKADFKHININNAFVIHQSPYDEMISHPESNITNTIRIPLSWG